MSSSDQHIFRVIDDTNLPYIRTVNPATTPPRPYLINGTNTMVHAGAALARRPGFDALHASFGANEKLRRVFGWNRLGTYYVMYNFVNTVAGTSKVYEGTTLIHTDATSANPFDFVVANNFLFFGNGIVQKKWDGTTVTNWGISPQPTTAPGVTNTAAGNVPGAIGHTWVYAYGVSATGYISDISAVSAASSAANRQWTIDGPRSTDTQCDLVHIYRTEDGGATYLELPNSPIANPGAGNFSIVDNAADASLSDTAAPERGVNQPPPLMIALKFFAGRIWGIVYNTDRLAFSGFEEVSNGLPVESFGTTLTNTFSFGEALTGLEVLGDLDSPVLLIWSGGTLFAVTGDTRTTFKRHTVAPRRGCKNRATIVASQVDSRNTISGVDTTISFVAWLDSTGSVRMITRSLGIREISKDISPDLDSIDHAQASMTIFESPLHRWLLLCDAGAGKIRTYDMESNIWNTPWPIATITHIGAAEISAGDYLLFAGVGTKVNVANDSSHTDDSVPYTASITLGPLPIVDPQRPEQLGNLEYVALEKNGVAIDSVGHANDYNPFSSPSFTNMATITGPFLRNVTAGAMEEKWYHADGGGSGPAGSAGARRTSIKISWAALDSKFELFSVTIVGTRFGDS